MNSAEPRQSRGLRSLALARSGNGAKRPVPPNDLLNQIKAAALLLCLLACSTVYADDAVMTTENSLTAIKGWLHDHAPPLELLLNPAATEDDMRRFESGTGITLPASVRVAYAMHNGEAPSSQGLFGSWRWLPLREVAAYRQELLRTGESLAKNAVPILMSGGGDFYCVDSVDTPGRESPVFEWWHEQPTRDVRHESFATFLHEFASALERGQYVYLPDSLNGLIDKDEL